MKLRLQQKWHSHTVFLYWWSLGVLLFLIWGITDYQAKDESILHSETIELKNGWKDEEGKDVTLPLKSSFQDQSYQLTTTISKENKLPQYLLFSAKYLNVHFYLDEEKIGSVICESSNADKTLGKKLALIAFPMEIKEGILRMEVQGLLKGDVQYEIKAPRIGDSASLIYEVVMGELPLLMINIVILCFGSFLLIYGIQAMRVMKRWKAAMVYQTSFLYIGLFAILFSFYSFVITDTIYLFASDSYVLYLMEFLLLALIPIPLLQLVMSVCNEKWKEFLGFDCIALFINFVMQAVCHLCFDIELKDTVWFTHMLMVISAILLIPSLLSIAFKGKEKWWLPLSFIPVIAGALLDISSYYIPNSYQKAFWFQCGVLCFLIIQTIYLIHQNMTTCESSLKSNLYRQMAYTDALTGFSNRAAFEAAINRIEEKQESYSSIWCICADINELKLVNDTLGHTIGDDLIKEAAELLHHAIGEEFKLYRTGGDEFVSFLFNLSKLEIDAIHQRMEHALTTHRPMHEYQLSIAIGIDQFHFSQQDTIARLISRCDALMYENKRYKKERIT